MTYPPQDDPFIRGYCDHMLGVEYYDCPYFVHDEDNFQQWKSGWRQCEQNTREAIANDGIGFSLTDLG